MKILKYVSFFTYQILLAIILYFALSSKVTNTVELEGRLILTILDLNRECMVNSLSILESKINTIDTNQRINDDRLIAIKDRIFDNFTTIYENLNVINENLKKTEDNEEIRQSDLHRWIQTVNNNVIRR